MAMATMAAAREKDGDRSLIACCLALRVVRVALQVRRAIIRKI
jgi:hypothetical protein